MTDPKARLEWLRALRALALDAIERTESGLHFLSGEGDEHIRDAAESWLAQHRAFAQKLERRIKLEEGGIA